MEYPDFISSLQQIDPALAAEIAEFHTLEGVLPWMEKKGISLGSTDVIFQDECCFDFQIPLPDKRWLVFGITCCGALTAVTVWSHHPSADEMLARRLEYGWLPTPSHLQEGKVVVGHAACLNPKLWMQAKRFPIPGEPEQTH